MSELLNLILIIAVTIDVYVFSSHADDLTFGGEGPVVILKDNRKAITMTVYTDDYFGAFIKGYNMHLIHLYSIDLSF